MSARPGYPREKVCLAGFSPVDGLEALRNQSFWVISVRWSGRVIQKLSVAAAEPASQDKAPFLDQVSPADPVCLILWEGGDSICLPGRLRSCFDLISFGGMNLKLAIPLAIHAWRGL